MTEPSPVLLASIEDVRARLDWTMSPDEERIATSALEDASDDARYQGRDWAPTDAPPMVRRIVLAAVVRYMRNPEGYNQSRAGDETVGWADDRTGSAGSVYFTEGEKEDLRALAGRSKSGLVSVATTAYGPVRRRHRVDGLNAMLPDPEGRFLRYDRCGDPDGLVPVESGGDWFPMFAEGDTS